MNELKIYKLTFLKFIQKEILPFLIVGFLFACLVAILEKDTDYLLDITSIVFFGCIFLCFTIFSPWYINYIFNDWGKELHIDKARKELFLRRGKEKIYLRFSEIDSVRKFHNGTLLNRNRRHYYRIRLKAPNDYVFFISHLTVENLEKEFDTEIVPIYYSEECCAFIPNWKMPNKRTLTDKDTR